MAKRLFSYSEENARQAVEVSELLEANHIDYYETPANRWGFSQATIWIQNNDDFDKAKSLFEEHVKDFALRAQQAYQEETGYDPGAPLMQRIRFNLRYMLGKAAMIPLVIVGIALVGIYLYLFQSLFSQ